MIDHLQRLAQRIQSLRLPSAVLGAAGLATLVVAVLILEPDQGDPYIIPGFIGMLWGMSTYSFIVAFRSAPGKNSNPVGVFRKLVHRLHRCWYGFISVVFLVTTVAVIVVTIRMISIWLRAYGG
jgi:hypothetical protein